jgi:hypothetical protein
MPKFQIIFYRNIDKQNVGKAPVSVLLVPGLLVQKGGRRSSFVFFKLAFKYGYIGLFTVIMKMVTSSVFFLVLTKCLQCCEARALSSFSRGWMLPYPIFSEALSIFIRLKWTGTANNVASQKF